MLQFRRHRHAAIVVNGLALLLVYLMGACHSLGFPVAECPASGAVAGMCPAPMLGVVIDEELRVIDIDAGSPAEEVGLVRGDILVAIEDISLATGRAAAKDLIHKYPIQHLQLLLERNGQPITVLITPGWARPALHPAAISPLSVSATMPAFPIRQPVPTATPVWPPFDYL